MKTGDPTRPLTIQERLGVALASLAGIVLIAGWSLTGVGAVEPRTDLALPSADNRTPAASAASVSAASTTAVSADAPLPDPAVKPRARASCAGCGVIVAVLRIDTPVAVMAGCYAGDGPESNARLISVGGLSEADSLANTVASVLADGRGKKKVTVNTRHQIVVRFRDGTKQVFDEATPRSLHVGDRIVVIAGTEQAKVLAGTRGVPKADLWSSVRSRTDG